MQRGVLLGAGAVVLVVGFLGARSVINSKAGRAVDQGIGQFVARLPPGYAIRHGATEYNPLTSAATLHDVVLTHDGATLATADTLTVSGADEQALQDVVDPARYPQGRPAWTDRRLLVADASAQGLRVTVPGFGLGNVAVRNMSVHRLSGRPFMLPPTEENRAKPELRADAALALAADSMQASDTVMTAQDASGGAKLQSVTLSDYDGGKLGSLAVKAAALDADGKPRGAPVHLEVGAADLKSADIRGVLEAIRKAGRSDSFMLGRTSYGSFDLSDAALDVTRGPRVTLHDMHASQGVADAASATGQGWIHGMTLALGQSEVPPSAKASLAAFGMNALTIDIDATSKMAAGASQGSLQEDIVLHDLGKLHLQGGFSGYDAARATPNQKLAAILATTLDHATIVYEDHSLANRLLAVAAVQMHSTPDVVRAQLAMPVVTLGLMLPDQPDAADQITSFLNHPGTLTITMNPPQRVTVGDVAQASFPARAHLLGVHITAK